MNVKDKIDCQKLFNIPYEQLLVTFKKARKRYKKLKVLKSVNFLQKELRSNKKVKKD